MAPQAPKNNDCPEKAAMLKKKNFDDCGSSSDSSEESVKRRVSSLVKLFSALHVINFILIVGLLAFTIYFFIDVNERLLPSGPEEISAAAVTSRDCCADVGILMEERRNAQDTIAALENELHDFKREMRANLTQIGLLGGDRYPTIGEGTSHDHSAMGEGTSHDHSSMGEGTSHDHGAMGEGTSHDHSSMGEGTSHDHGATKVEETPSKPRNNTVKFETPHPGVELRFEEEGSGGGIGSPEDIIFVDDEYYDDPENDQVEVLGPGDIIEGSGSHHAHHHQHHHGAKTKNCVHFSRPVCPDGCYSEMENPEGCKIPICCLGQ